MQASLRSLSGALSIATLLFTAGCSKSTDADPQAPTGTVTGTYTPVSALASVTATPVAGGAATQATLSSPGGTYSLKLLAGTYTLVYAPAPGYLAPPTQTVTSTVDKTLSVPALTVTSQRFVWLTTPNWRVTARTYSTTQNGVTTTQDLYPTYTTCDRTALHKFNANKNYTVQITCNVGSAPVFADTWDIGANDTQFYFGTSPSTAILINQLTATTLELVRTFSSGGTTNVDKTVYTAQ